MVVERGHRSWQVHVDDHLEPDALARDLDTIAASGGGPVFVWVSGPTSEDDDRALAAGLRLGRDLLQMRVDLPLDGPAPELPWRPFEPGVDEPAWLEVNNRAFDWHPEQGGWTADILAEHTSEPWFDPAGFLLHERDGRLAAFCWTKVHRDVDPPLGEIYTIAVDPDFHGSGLGRAITVAALDWLHHERGISIGMLYVDSANEPAVRLYERLGFTVHHIDRAYAGDVEAT
jgi:mycothiol synthase